MTVKNSQECVIERYVCRDGSCQYWKSVDASNQQELPYTLCLFNWAHASAMSASANGLVFCSDLNIKDGQRVEYTMDGVPESQPLFDFVRSRQTRQPAERDRVSFMTRLCRVVNTLQHDGFVHRDLHSRNILLSESGKVSVIDYDLCAFVGGVDGMPADMQLQQSFPTVFSAWGQITECVHPYYDSQQLAISLASLFLWENVCPVMPTGMVQLFPDYCDNQCVVCKAPVSPRSKGCCGCDQKWCKAVILRFNSLWTWPLHLQHPDKRCTEYTDRMRQFLEETKAGPRYVNRFLDACERTKQVQPVLYERIKGTCVNFCDCGRMMRGVGKSDEGRKWCNIIEALSSDPPVAIESVIPELKMRNELPSFSPLPPKIDPDRQTILRSTAKCVLNFYLRHATKTCARQPILWLCEYLPH